MRCLVTRELEAASPSPDFHDVRHLLSPLPVADHAAVLLAGYFCYCCCCCYLYSYDDGDDGNDDDDDYFGSTD